MPERVCLPLAIGLVLAAPAVADDWPEPLRAASEANGAQPAYAYDLTIDVGEQTARARIDPSAAEGGRLDVLSPPEAEWSEALQEVFLNIENNLDGRIGCSRMLEMVPAQVELVVEDGETATYTFTPQPLPEMEGQQRKMMGRLEGQITVSKGGRDILAYSMTLPKPYKPAIVAKIDHFFMDIGCAPAPDGRQVYARRVMEISGSALGNAFDDREVYTISNPVRLDAAAGAMATAK